MLWIFLLPYLLQIALKEGMILSDEPGYYENGSFGIRLESLVVVVKKETEHNFLNKGYLTFDPITMVPIQTRMIDPKMLSEKEVSTYYSII